MATRRSFLAALLALPALGIKLPCNHRGRPIRHVWEGPHTFHAFCECGHWLFSYGRSRTTYPKLRITKLDRETRTVTYEPV